MDFCSIAHITAVATFVVLAGLNNYVCGALVATRTLIRNQLLQRQCTFISSGAPTRAPSATSTSPPQHRADPSGGFCCHRRHGRDHGTYTLVEKPAGCAVVNGSNIDLVSGFTAERVMVFPAALNAPQITAIRGAM
jgi:hypothetical protein